MEAEFARWDDIDVHFKGEVVTSGGHGFAAMARKRLLQILQERCAELDVDVRFSTPAPDVAELARDYDLVVACDGLNSAVRTRYADTFRPTLDVRDCRYMWLGTDKVFDAFKFYVAQTPHGVMQIHGYPFDRTGSTFIVEMNSEVWENAGFGAHARALAARRVRRRLHRVGARDLRRRARRPRGAREQLPLGHLHDGAQRALRHENVVLLGDAAHTAHFSIGSGTKLAMEDAPLARGLPARGGVAGRRPGGLRDRAQGGGALHAARRSGQPRVVREPRPVRSTRSRCSSGSTS